MSTETQLTETQSNARLTAHLRRQLEKATTARKALSDSRKFRELRAAEKAVQVHLKDPVRNTPEYLRRNGFVFSERAWADALYYASLRTPLEAADCTLAAIRERHSRVREKIVAFKDRFKRVTTR